MDDLLLTEDFIDAFLVKEWHLIELKNFHGFNISLEMSEFYVMIYVKIQEKFLEIEKKENQPFLLRSEM